MNKDLQQRESRVGVNRRQQNVAVVADTTDLLLSKDSPWSFIRKQVDQLRSNIEVLVSPGERQFKDVPKRVRMMIISIGVPLLFAFAKLLVLPQNQSLYIWAIVAFVLGAVTYVGMIWGLKGQVRQDSYTTVLLLPSLFVLANVLFLSFLFVGEINRVYLWGLFGSALALFMVLLYILALAVNILNVTFFYTIPLSRLGETVAYIFSIFTVFLGAYVIAESAIPLFVNGLWIQLAVQVASVFLSTIALTSALWGYFVISSKGLWASVIGLSTFLTVSLFIFIFTLPYAWLAGVTQGVVAYLLLGFVIHKEQNSFKYSVVIEYLVAIIALFLLGIFV